MNFQSLLKMDYAIYGFQESIYSYLSSTLGNISIMPLLPSANRLKLKNPFEI